MMNIESITEYARAFAGALREMPEASWHNSKKELDLVRHAEWHDRVTHTVRALLALSAAVGTPDADAERAIYKSAESPFGRGHNGIFFVR